MQKQWEDSGRSGGLPEGSVEQALQVFKAAYAMAVDVKADLDVLCAAYFCKQAK